MTMQQMDVLLSDLSSGYFIRQVLAILFLFIVGVLFLYGIHEKLQAVWLYLLAYPIGLALWCIAGFVLLSLGIRFSLLTELLTILLILLLAWLVTMRRHRFTEQTEQIAKPFFKTAIAAAVILVAACVATSGIISVSISNDTMYYYMYYPEVLVKAGAYLSGFDVFLSDVGPMAAMIGTVPVMFGFDQFYGIQQVFQMNFVLIFAYMVYDRAKEKLETRTAMGLTIVAVLLLISATPYVVISKWILANVYVMCYSFILFGLAERVSREREQGRGEQRDLLIVMMVLSAVISMLRMEGGMLMCFMIICISTLCYSNREMIVRFLLPAAVMPCLYYFRYFIFLKVSPVYSFLTWQKAAVAVGAMILLGHYLGGIRGRHFIRLQRQTGWLIIVGLLIVNAGLFVIAPSDYMVVLRAYVQNFVYRQGWGYVIYLVLAAYLALFIAGWVKHKTLRYENLVFLGYIFYTLAVGFARGGGLRMGIADSGNRVMLQVIPFMVYALVCPAMELLSGNDRGNE